QMYARPLGVTASGVGGTGVCRPSTGLLRPSAMAIVWPLSLSRTVYLAGSIASLCHFLKQCRTARPGRPEVPISPGPSALRAPARASGPAIPPVPDAAIRDFRPLPDVQVRHQGLKDANPCDGRHGKMTDTMTGRRLNQLSREQCLELLASAPWDGSSSPTRRCRPSGR